MLELAIPAFVVAMAVASMLSKQRRQRARNAWREAAAELGMRFDDHDKAEKMQIVGRIHGHQVRVRVITRRQNDKTRFFTVYELRFKEPLALGANLRAVGLMSSLSQLIGIRDVEVGDPSFDQRVHIEARDIEGLEEWLSDARRTRIQRFLVGHTEAQIDDVGMRWVSAGLTLESYVVTGHVESLVKTAEVLVGEEEDVDPDEAERRRHREARKRARERRERRERQRRKPRRQRGSEAEKRTRGEGREGKAGRARDEQGRSRKARNRSVSDAARPVAPPPAAEPSVPDNVLRDPVPVAEALFGRGLEGLDASVRFEADFADRPVAWQGALRRLEKVTVDFVFGDGPFTRATVELHREDSDPLGARTLRAVVHLPAEANEALRPRLDKNLKFTGRLVAIDPFSRSLFVSEGVVE